MITYQLSCHLRVDRHEEEMIVQWKETKRIYYVGRDKVEKFSVVFLFLSLPIKKKKILKTQVKATEK